MMMSMMKNNSMLISETMKVKKLYIVNDDAEDVDMAVVGGLLSAMGYGLVEYRCYRYDQDLERCEGGECDYVEMLMDRVCIDEIEFETDCNADNEDGVVHLNISCDLDDVIDDLYYVSTTKKADMGGMIFVIETVDGEYVELDYNSIVGKVMKDFIEEWR
jgi:hypothetical protein